MRTYFALLAELQGQILLAVTYLVVVLPVWAALRLTRRDLLDVDRRSWHRRTASADPLGDLRLPF